MAVRLRLPTGGVVGRRTTAYRMSCVMSDHINFLARSHLDRHLAVLAQLRLLSGQPRLGELEDSNGSARRSIPQFRRERLDPQQAYVGIVRAARPPHLVGLSP